MARTKNNAPELMVAFDAGEPVKPEKDRKFVESLSRGLDVLRAFTQGSVILGNQDIARITGLPKPTVSRMTYTLTKLGYLSYNTQLEKYQLSSGVLALGYAYVSNLKVRQLAKPYMDEFARQTNMSVGLTCRDRLHMIYVENRLPPEASLLRMEIGLKLPLATTAAGRAYYCAIGDQDRALLDDALALKYGEDWPEKRQGLTQAMEDYRAHGFCLSLGEWDRNINSAGVPIHLQDGTIMALTCSAPSYLVPADRLRDTIAHQLAMLAGDIESLGV
ncbi:IclR family transcriptional regulator [Marinobacter lutaoensis]|jgi:DNA-binding IclR family transcriptional regulator|uniref:IclR family transcriptional regulator n=2 Tax=Marinobacter TaxID=2742 RepID=A0A1V2DUR3_9GAMM|nr:IclR family transcriptional regulator [Oceanospirillales bacterium]NVD34176.1 IclR family transcriptional regulator [Marinobacter lutaoensis]ONF44327.1 IclR family transcriptional regulator [Marinobacter lutaoensis]|tara:strand:+ start:1509 stop:2333 length:825 start_codon:yes stop_codon:yes gene_type:complete